MRRRWQVGMIVVLLMALGPAGAFAGPVERLTILGGPAAGVFNVFATGLATFLSRSVPGMEVTVAATGGSVENVRRVNGKEAELAVAFASDVHEGYYGLEAFQGNPQRNIRAIGLLFIGVGHFVAYKDSGIRTVGDLAGKRVAVGSPGSGTFANAQRVLTELGLWDRIQRVPLLGSAAAAALRDGRVDAFFFTAPYPDRATIEAAIAREVHLLDLYGPLSRTEFFRKYPYFIRYVIPSRGYHGLTDSVSTIGIPGLWFTHRDVSPALVRRLVAAAYSREGHAHMLQVHAASADMTTRRALLGVSIPLHPGAEAHYRSVGLEIPDAIRAR
ncbi:MAG: TAXI family TRAP transporter solute-binding subunit [Armatimonadota bacterium]|nr:TAXI family TRAP transporter solute-binding subunit [Armatimonadota bacterium]MDR7561952.1 TAXI family TRAP transporter solute-binding subunit [Armatimonadota bacterium]MDR7566899.1 TAXI family TRAP transporter solute-binding subunit [Armatimonadota bacterium]